MCAMVRLREHGFRARHAGCGDPRPPTTAAAACSAATTRRSTGRRGGCRARVRPAVHALYGFVRGADEIVDGRARRGPAAAAPRSTPGRRELEPGLRDGRSAHPVIAALVDAGARHDLPLELSSGPTWTRCASTAAPGADRHARRARPLHGRQRRDGRAHHGAAARRPARATEEVGAARRRLPADELHPRRARGLGAGPHLPARPGRGRPARAARRPPRRAPRSPRRSAARGACSPRPPRLDAALDPRCARGCASRARVYVRVLDRVERSASTSSAAARGSPPWEAGWPPAARCCPPGSMTVRATKRGAERTSLDGERADVLVCGASFAGLAVARELAGSGADVLSSTATRSASARPRPARRRRRGCTRWASRARSARSCRT